MSELPRRPVELLHGLAVITQVLPEVKSSINSFPIPPIICETRPWRSSSLATFERNREKLELPGAGLRGGRSITVTPAPIPPVPGLIPYLPRLCTGTGLNPHMASSDEFRLSSRMSEEMDSCWKTMPAISAFHIADTGYSLRPFLRMLPRARMISPSGKTSSTS